MTDTQIRWLTPRQAEPIPARRVVTEWPRQRAVDWAAHERRLQQTTQPAIYTKFESQKTQKTR